MRHPIAILSTGLVLGCGVMLTGSSAPPEQTNELSQALKLEPDRAHGRALYENCAACHQPDGGGEARSGIPAIAGQHYQMIIKQLTDFRDTQRLDLRMEAFASRHHLEGPQDLADVADFISSLRPQPTDDFGTGQFLQAGRHAYTRACLRCHGAAAEGDNRRRYPRLAGQHYPYLLKQIDTMIGGSRFNVSSDHARLLESLTDEEMTGVADYLSRLNAPSGFR